VKPKIAFETVRRRRRGPARVRRRLPINARLALSSDWSIYAHHGTSRDDHAGIHYEHWERPAVGEAKRHEYEARFGEIPEDTRDLTGRLLGDPLPGRSALARIRRGS
jgi:hypothetical protein